MKIRRDALAVSSILFTVALLMLAPAMWGAAATIDDIGPFVSGPEYRYYDCFAPQGFGSLAVIGIGLIVTWAGYIKGVRWTWFVMFVIVALWAFPTLMLPYLHPWPGVATFAQGFARSISQSLHSGPIREFARSFVEVVLAFLLMVLALILPVKTFILGRGDNPCRG